MGWEISLVASGKDRRVLSASMSRSLVDMIIIEYMTNLPD